MKAPILIIAALLAPTLVLAAGDNAPKAATDPVLEGQSFANEPAVLLAPDLDAIVTRAAELYTQVGDAAAKQLTEPKATPAPTPSPRP